MHDLTDPFDLVATVVILGAVVVGCVLAPRFRASDQGPVFATILILAALLVLAVEVSR